MSTNPVNNTFDPQTLADDLREVRRIYTEFFATLDETSWDKPVKAGSKEWTLHETVAHLRALNRAGLESIKHALRGDAYTFTGLETGMRATKICISWEPARISALECLLPWSPAIW